MIVFNHSYIISSNSIKKNKVSLNLIRGVLLFFFFYDFIILFKILNFFYNKLNNLIFIKNINVRFLFSNYVYLNFLLNKKDNYLFNVLVLKKQNSIMKKKINVSNSFLSFNYKRSKLLEKSFFLESNFRNDKNVVNKYCYYYNYFSFYYNFFYKISTSKLIDVRKKIKKLVLDNRKVLNILYFNRIKYSNKLTKLIFSFSKLKIWWNLINFEKRICNVLVNSCLTNTVFDSSNLIKNKNVYLNRVLITNYSKVIKVGDCIELVINNNYFIYNYNLNLMVDKNLIKYKSKLLSNIKQKDNSSNSSDKFLFRFLKDNNFFKKNIPLYLEVDFFVLSCIIFRDLKTYDDLSFVNRKLLTFFMYKTYNWKWIS